MFHTVGLGPKGAFSNDIDVNLFGAGLKSTDEVAGKPDTCNTWVEAPGHEQVNGAQADGIAGAPVDDAIEVTVLGIVVVTFVATKAEIFKEILVDHAEHLLGRRGKVDSLPQFSGPGVIERLVSLDIRIRILRLSQQSSGQLE